LQTQGLHLQRWQTPQMQGSHLQPAHVADFTSPAGSAAAAVGRQHPLFIFMAGQVAGEAVSAGANPDRINPMANTTVINKAVLAIIVFLLELRVEKLRDSLIPAPAGEGGA